jgi:5,10-methylenetetrahydromethanopterin reductase
LNVPRTPRVRFGTVTFTENFTDYMTWLRVAEDLGYDFAGYGDSQSLWADVYVALAAAAGATSRVRLGPLVTNPVTRHPAVTAGAMASLQTLSQGRAFLGIGTGDSALLNIGERPATVKRFAAYCEAVKGLCAGEKVTWESHELTMSWPVSPVPIWMAAEGPRMLHLAGRLADGVIVASGISEGVIEHVIGCVAAGASEAGRGLEEIEMWWMLKPYLAATEKEGWRDLAWTLAGTANHLFRFSMEDKFVPDDLREPIRTLQKRYASNTHGKVSQGAQNARLVEELGLTEWLGRRFALAGPGRTIISRIEEIVDRGATNLLLPQFVADRVQFMRDFDAAVMTAFR